MVEWWNSGIAGSKRSLPFIVLVLTAVSALLPAQEAAHDRSFPEQLKRVQDHIKAEKLQLRQKMLAKSGDSLVKALLALKDRKITDFLEKGAEVSELVVVRDVSRYTAIILNPVIAENTVYYRLLFADVSDITNIKGLIIYTEDSGRIAYALVKHKITPTFIVELVDDAFFPDECYMKMDMTDKKSSGRKVTFSFDIHAVRNFGSVMEFTSCSTHSSVTNGLFPDNRLTFAVWDRSLVGQPRVRSGDPGLRSVTASR